MPFIRITVAGAALTSAQRHRLQQVFTDEVHRLLHKRREVTAVAVIEMATGSWAVDGRAVGGGAAHVEIVITQGTNNAVEKAAMLASADTHLREILGTLPEATYVAIHELSAEAWGYAGRSQASRR